MSAIVSGVGDPTSVVNASALARGDFGADEFVVNKRGRNTDIDSGTLPEDIWGGGGAYTGFPLGAPELIRVTSTSASDTGVLTITGLKSDASTNFETETITLNGTTPVVSVNTWWRVHTASYNAGSPFTGFNVGNITVQHDTTTANVFLFMAAGRSETNCSAITVPAGKVGVVKTVVAMVEGSSANSVEIAGWIRFPNTSPRLLRAATVRRDYVLQEEIMGGTLLPAGTDIVIRAVGSDGSNISMIAGYAIQFSPEE